MLVFLAARLKALARLGGLATLKGTLKVALGRARAVLPFELLLEAAQIIFQLNFGLFAK